MYARGVSYLFCAHMAEKEARVCLTGRDGVGANMPVLQKKVGKDFLCTMLVWERKAPQRFCDTCDMWPPAARNWDSPGLEQWLWI